MLFQDRGDAGRQLAERLSRYREADPLVLALPRGGVAIGHEVARALGAPLDVLVARKLNAPSHPELGIGAVAPGGVRVLDDLAIQAFQVSTAQVAEITAAETAEMERRLQRYRGDRPFPDLRNRTVILVDDGLATGLTAQAAVQAIRQCRPRRLVLAVPVGAPSTVEALRSEVEELICIATPLNLMAVSYWYHQFEPLSDEDVVALLEQATSFASEPAGAEEPGVECHDQPPSPVVASPSAGSESWIGEQPVRVPAGAVVLEGDLALPTAPRGVILFAHGSGSDRRSPRHRVVAHWLRAAGFGTLLLDLLTSEEAAVDAETREHRFDIDRLAQRLAAGTDWLSQQPATQSLPVGLFGASTGAAAALITAAERPVVVRAVISRGGRPDLAGAALERVQAPSLLIVGGSDLPVLRLNREAFQSLAGEKKLVVVPGAGHLFEEPGAIEAVAALTTDWLIFHLAPS